MFYAQNGTGGRILAEDAAALPKDRYFCPMCKSEVRLRKGSIRAKHFAHVSKEDCDSFSSEMSEWHLEWQGRFPEECREVVLEADGEKHRADVLYHDIIVEFQHSPISKEEFERRNAFYTKVARHLVWVFDFRDRCEAGTLSSSWHDDKISMYEWKWASRTLVGFDPEKQSKVSLVFHLDFSEPPAPFLCWVSDISHDFGWEFFHSRSERIQPQDFPTWIDTIFIPELDKRDYLIAHPPPPPPPPPQCPHCNRDAAPTTRNGAPAWYCPSCDRYVYEDSTTDDSRKWKAEKERMAKEKAERMMAQAAAIGNDESHSPTPPPKRGPPYPSDCCPICGADMELHPGRWVDNFSGFGKKYLEPFWGCATFRWTHCRGRRPVVPPRCPECKEKMVIRENRKTGDVFWGCSRFPDCRGTRMAILEP